MSGRTRCPYTPGSITTRTWRGTSQHRRHIQTLHTSHCQRKSMEILLQFFLIFSLRPLGFTLAKTQLTHLGPKCYQTRSTKPRATSSISSTTSPLRSPQAERLVRSSPPGLYTLLGSIDSSPQLFSPRPLPGRFSHFLLPPPFISLVLAISRLIPPSMLENDWASP